MGTGRESRYPSPSRRKRSRRKPKFLGLLHILTIFVLLAILSRLGLIAPGGDLIDLVTKILSAAP